MRCLNEYDDGWFREADVELTASVDQLWRIFVRACVFFLIVILMNEMLSTSTTVEGAVVGTSSKKLNGGRKSAFTGVPSMFSPSTFQIEKTYQVTARLETGEIVSFICFPCSRFSYTSGDSISLLETERIIGRLTYSAGK
ncbi:hypothetical protein SYJ56_03315 [Algoriphagus sp. D3-2-R+10]|uniref:hypothetical protein n=1 Tax=Algoriphagus aurantiacus TaxID=3103948 RepID=UPI002B3FCDEE|nr:hypothetical protein [Algoriphagus sp. D3-2-R+10]MEB2774317.1 hypothetical protein [Algoriphagus sp. D3-2-R+10]